MKWKHHSISEHLKQQTCFYSA